MGRTIDAIDRDIGEAIMAIAQKGKMRPLLAISAGIDLLNEKIGNLCNFLVLAACAVSAGNAMIRYAFGYSSNGWLELQWYMFAVFVMFGASYTFKRNEHVRVEIFYLMLSERGQLWLDLIGTLCFLIPVCLLLSWLSWPFFYQAYEVGEHSSNAGGLLRWPIKLVVPVGFVMLALQGVSEVIKRIAALQNIRYITGVLAASGTITQLVPPSLVLIVLADQLGKSVGDMYLGAWGPSLFQIALFAGYTFLLGIIKPDHVPPVPKSALTLTGWPLWRKCLMGIIPSAVLIFVVLGTMMLGLATPTEAGAMGAVGAVVLAAIHHKEFSAAGNRVLMIGVIAAGVGTILGILYTESLLFKLAFAVTYLAVIWICLEAVRIPDLRDLIRQGYQSTMRLTSMVVFILIGSTCFSVVFLGVSGGVWLEHMLTSVPGGVWGFLIFINLFIFFLAFFLDFFEIAFIILPMVAPIAQKILTPIVGADAALIWFGVMICVNVQTSFLHPPFGFALFYLRGVAPREVKSSDIYWGAVPWIGLQVIMVVLVIAFPWTVTALLDKPVSAEEASKIRIEVPQVELPVLDFGQPKSQ